jgi:hypothetical protein
MLALFAFVAQDYILRVAETSAVAVYGPFRLERENCVEHRDVAVLHYASCFPKARLVWSSADGLATVWYEDNGGSLTGGYRYPLRKGVPDACFPDAPYIAYGPQPGRAEDWRNRAKEFGERLARCGPLDAAQRAAYETEFAAAADHYEAAAGGLRSLARTMFHTLRRCTRFKYSERYPSPGARATCSREEGPAS